MMDSAQRTHLEHLLQIHRAHLRELELKAAKYGELETPPHIALQIAEYHQKIAGLEEQVRQALPHHNLPPRDYERFIGRQRELEEVRRLLRPYPKSRAYVITIDGIGGIGKSALALETAYSYREGYAALPEAERFEAIVWVSAKRTYLTADGILERRQVFRTLDDLYTAIAQVLDFPAITRAPAAEQRAIVEQALGEQRTLLILDNLETVDDEELMVFLRELPDPAKAIVTTRHRIDVAHPVRLTGMAHADALALIDQEAARKHVILAPEEREELWVRTGGVPLAIVWSIGLIGLGGSVVSVLRRLGQGQSDIARFCFEESVAQIRGRDAHRLLLALALFAADASREALGVVAGLGEDEFGRDLGLEELLRLSLINKEGERFSLLPLTRSFVQSETANQEQWMEDARERWQQYFYTLTTTLGGWKEDWHGQDVVERELVNIFAVISSLLLNIKYQKIDDEQIVDPVSVPYAGMMVDLIDKVARTCRLRGYWKDCENLSHIAININILLNNALASGWRYHDLARIRYYLGDITTAERWALEARSSAYQKENTHLMHRSNLLLGLIALHSNRVEEAQTLLTAAFHEHQRSGSQRTLPNFTAGLGELAEFQGDLMTAVNWYRQGVELSRQNDHLSHLASNLLSLGRVSLALGRSVDAQSCYTESLNVARECGRVDVIAGTLYSMAALEYNQNNSFSAKDKAHQARDLYRRLGMQRQQAEVEALLARLEEEA